MKARVGLSVLFVVLGLNASLVFADGEMKAQQRYPNTNQNSDASFDRRLPPVLPGEEVKDGDKKMKMWSTSGPVPVGRAPEPFDDPRPQISPQVGVVIDDRHGRRNDR